MLSTVFAECAAQGRSVAYVLVEGGGAGKVIEYLQAAIELLAIIKSAEEAVLFGTHCMLIILAIAVQRSTGTEHNQTWIAGMVSKRHLAAACTRRLLHGRLSVQSKSSTAWNLVFKLTPNFTTRVVGAASNVK